MATPVVRVKAAVGSGEEGGAGSSGLCPVREGTVAEPSV